VGVDRTHFTVHEKSICSFSPFFDKAVNGPWRESMTKTVDLPDDEPEIFAELLRWLYGHTAADNHNRNWFYFPRNWSSVLWLKLCKLWVLADKLGVSDLQNCVIKQMANSYRSLDGRIWPPPPNYIYDNKTLKPPLQIRAFSPDYIYDNTTPKSPLRYMIVDICIHHKMDEEVAKYADDASVDFIRDFQCRAAMYKKAGGVRRDEPPWESGVWSYLLIRKKEDDGGETCLPIRICNCINSTSTPCDYCRQEGYQPCGYCGQEGCLNA
jgi:hypothetical protein